MSITWTDESIATGNWEGIASDGTQVCVTQSPGSVSAVSADGITWTYGTLPHLQGWRSVAWNGSVFCSVVFDSGGVTTTMAATSPDGITWTERTLPSSVIGYSGIAWNGSVFCAVGLDTVATSPDGITWTARTIASGDWRGIAWNGSVFCAIAMGGNVAATSPDGVTWTSRTMSSSDNWWRIAWNGHVFCAITLLARAAATSPDGITWTACNLPVSFSAFSIASSNIGLFCVVSSGTTIAFSDDNGVTWGSDSGFSPSSGYTGVAWNSTKFIAVGQNQEAIGDPPPPPPPPPTPVFWSALVNCNEIP